MALSSINFKKMGKSTGSFLHNDRSIKPNYLIDDTAKNEVSCSSEQAIQKYHEYLDIAKQAYKERTGQRLQARHHLIEAVVNLNKKHTLQDVQELARAIEEKTGLKTIQIAVHKDEGHIKDGKKEYNYHAHISFFNLDLKTGRTIARNFKRKELSELQDITAETLNMDRGQKAEITGRKHLDHKEYKEHIRQVEKERATQKATQKQLKEEIAQLRAELREANKQLEVKIYTKDDYAKINKLNRELQEQIKKKELTLMELREQIAELRKALEEKEQQDLKNIKELAEMREKLEIQKIVTEMREQEKRDLEQSINTATVALEMQETVITALEQEKSDLKQDIVALEEQKTATVEEVEELAELQKTIDTQKTTISTLKSEKSDLEQQLRNAENTIETQRTTINTLKSEKSDLRMQVLENQKFDRSYNFINSKNVELLKKLRDAEGTIETLEKEKRDLIAKYREIRDAFTEITQAIGIKFDTVKQVVTDIISRFKSTKEVAKEPEPVKKVDDDIWKQIVESAEKFNQRFKPPKLR